MKLAYPAHAANCSLNRDQSEIEAVFGEDAMPDCSCGFDDRMHDGVQAEHAAALTIPVRHQTARRLWCRASHRFGFYRAPERLQMAVAWHLPHWLVRQTVNRAIAHGTTGAFGHTILPSVSATEIFRRWDDSRGGDRWAVRHRRKYLTEDEEKRVMRLLPDRVVTR